MSFIPGESGGIVTGSQLDRLCQGWLRENCGEAIASEYTMWNSADLDDALEDLRLELCLSFGPEQSFGTTDYYQAREKRGLPDGGTPVPDVFVRAFARN